MKTLKPLSLKALQQESAIFTEEHSGGLHLDLFGRANSKVVGTYFEKLLDKKLSEKYEFESGNSASGIDYPELNVDLKVTSIIQPQSSCPYRSARQKIYGLGYDLLIFVYQRTEISSEKTTRVDFLNTIFIDKSCTSDWQTTYGIQEILRKDGNKDDLIGFFYERNLPLDEIGAVSLAEEVINTPPGLGYLTISNALQWRLQYGRAISKAGKVPGVIAL